MKFRLKELRKERKMSQEELSRVSRVSRATIGKLENDEEAVVMSKTLLALANALSVEVEELFVNQNG